MITHDGFVGINRYQTAKAAVVALVKKKFFPRVNPAEMLRVKLSSSELKDIKTLKIKLVLNMNREFVCIIICSNSYQLKIEYEAENIQQITGAQCPKGEAFVENEITNPLRAFVGSVKMNNEDF